MISAAERILMMNVVLKFVFCTTTIWMFTILYFANGFNKFVSAG
jgi:hypothetical protein